MRLKHIYVLVSFQHACNKWCVFELNFEPFSSAVEFYNHILLLLGVCGVCQSVTPSDSQFTNAHMGAMFIIRMHFSMKDCLWHDSSFNNYNTWKSNRCVCVSALQCWAVKFGKHNSLLKFFNSSISIDIFFCSSFSLCFFLLLFTLSWTIQHHYVKQWIQLK